MKIPSEGNNPASIGRRRATLVVVASAVLSLFILVVMTLAGRASASNALAPVTSMRPPLTAPQSCSGPSFGSAINSGVRGAGLVSVFLGYIDNDSYLDIASGNTTGGGATWLPGSGNGSFGPAHGINAPGTGVYVAIADLNHDNKSDLVTGNFNGNLSYALSVFLGDGLGGFGTATNYAAGSGSYYVAVGDLNHDNNPDIVAANYEASSVSVLLGNGSGSFGPAITYTAGTAPQSVAIGDVNHDNNPDLVTANSGSNNVSILLGNGSGGFAAPANFPAGSSPSQVRIADMNNDGKPDLVVANHNSNNVSVLLGNESGGFGAPTNFSVGTQPVGVAVADFNGDGNLDIVTSNNGSNNVSVLQGNGLGGFAAAVNFPVASHPAGIDVGDINNDGSPDIATANIDSDSNISVLLNTCPGSFPSATPTAAAATATVATPTATPTSCPPGQFSDVNTCNVFYHYITCLVNAGVISGYSTSPPCTGGVPCFLPFNNVTRGQMAKFISQAAGYQDIIPSTRQTFTDVPNTNPFWLYVERAALHGVVGGYSTSPPCTTGTPCFLPTNSVTRAQTAKFVSNTFLPNCQTFLSPVR